MFSLAELVAAFDWEHCGRGDGKFDPKKFLAIDHEHLKTERLTSDDDYATRVAPFLVARGLPADHDTVKRALYTIRERAQTFVQAADMLDPMLRSEPEMDPKAVTKFLVKDAAERLVGLRDALMTSDWTEAALDATAHAWIASQGLEMKAIGQPVRVALTGRTASPGLFQIMFVIGRDATLARLAKAAEIAAAC